MTPDRERVLLSLVAVSLAVLLVGAAVGAVAPGASVGGRAPGDAAHADPATVGEGSSLSAVERRLADRLAQRARSGSLNLSREQIQQARERVNGTQYESLLNRYADVANQTGAVNRSLAFRRTQNRQAALVTAIDRYWQAHERYQRIQQFAAMGANDTLVRDNTSATRLAARTLERRWATVTDRRRALLDAYRNLAARTEGNFTDARASVNESVRAINATQRTVRDAEFERTQLQVFPSAAAVAFDKPLAIRGRLTAGTTPVADRNVTVTVGNRTYETRTDEAGWFSIAYRPTLLSANTTSLTVEYHPDPGSPYLGASDDLTVAVEPVRPEVTVEATPDRVRYGDALTVDGQVGSVGMTTGRLPYLLTLGGEVLARNETAPNGSFHANVTVPADVTGGERPVQVRFPLEGRALLGTRANATVDVAASATNLTATVGHVEGRTIRVSGTLRTARGVPVPDRSITVSANGTTLGAATTGRDGGFETTLVVPESVASGGPFDSTVALAVTLRYDGAGTSLADAAATESVRLPATPVGVLALGAVALLVVVVGALLVRGRLWSASAPAASVEATPDDPGSAVTVDGAVPVDSLVDRARERLADGEPGAAADVGYAALRRALDAPAADPSLTHWEFYRACREGLDAETAETLQRVTELYERARFAPEALDDERVDATLERIERTVGESATRR